MALFVRALAARQRSGSDAPRPAGCACRRAQCYGRRGRSGTRLQIYESVGVSSPPRNVLLAWWRGPANIGRPGPSRTEESRAAPQPNARVTCPVGISHASARRRHFHCRFRVAPPVGAARRAARIPSIRRAYWAHAVPLVLRNTPDDALPTASAQAAADLRRGSGAPAGGPLDWIRRPLGRHPSRVAGRHRFRTCVFAATRSCCLIARGARPPRSAAQGL